MRIIHIIPKLFQGGAENFLISLSNEQSKNHDVEVVTLFKNNEILERKLNEKIQLTSFNKKQNLNIIFDVFRYIKKQINLKSTAVKKKTVDVMREYPKNIVKKVSEIEKIAKKSIIYNRR